jgi:DNA-binding transcriptional ArsR family regulator
MVDYLYHPWHIPFSREDMSMDEAQLDKIFHALSDTTRRRLLNRLAEKECMVTELAEPYAMSLNAISKHLKVLEAAGLLRRTKDGRVHRCRIDIEPLGEVERVVAYYKQFWECQMDQLEHALKQLKD